MVVARPESYRVSILLMVDSQRERGARALASLLAQPGIEDCELLLADFGADRFPPLPGSDHPAVVTLPLRRGWSRGPLIAYWATIARAPILATIEEHALAGDGWLATIQEAFTDERLAGLGGPPANANPHWSFSRLVHLLLYRGLLGLTQPAERALLPGHNSTYRRSALLALGPALADLVEAESLLNEVLHRQGWRLRLDPRLRWAHQNETALGTLCRGLFLWNRVCGGLAPRALGWGWGKRLLKLLRLPLSPWVRVVRALLAARGEERWLVLRFWALVLVIEYVAVSGQALGYLRGPSSSGRQLFDYELNAPRGD